MITMQINIDANQFESYLDERIMKLSDFEMTILTDFTIFPFLSDRVSKRFDSSGDAASGSWPPVSAAALSKRIVNTGLEPLVDTGELRTWAEDPPGTRGVAAGGFIALDYPSTAPTDTITNYKYLMAQFGIDNTFGRAGVYTPKRPIFAVDTTDLTGIMLILFGHIMT